MVIPALIIFVMVMGAFQTTISPQSSSSTTAGQPATQTGTRSQGPPSVLSQGSAGGTPSQTSNSGGGVARDPVSRGIVFNQNFKPSPAMQPEPFRVTQRPSGVSFTSVGVPTPTVLRSDPTPASQSVDAGGPYGGPNTFEGDTIVFTATVSDPSLIYFRWDFNGDGKWDTGTAANGNWVTDNPIAYTYRNMFNGDVLVQAWDGISTTTTSYTGNILGTSTPGYYGYVYGAYTIGDQYTAKQAFTLTQLRVYHWQVYWNPQELGIWTSGGALLGKCTPPSTDLSWDVCSVSPISIASGESFRIGVRLSSTSYWMGQLMSSYPSNPYVTDDGMYYSGSTGGSLIFPVYYLTNFYFTYCDFSYSYTVVTPNTVQDTAHAEVNNVAPVVFDLSTTPTTIPEGTVAKFHAMFYDPGLDEQWTYRWCYGDGTCDDWGSIRVGSGLSQLANILVYSDVAPHYAAQALDYYGVKYTLVTDIFSLPNMITSRQWDLIIYQSYYIAFVAPTIEDAMMTQLKGGALIMYNNWYSNNRLTHPLFAYFGVSALTGYTTPIPLYQWDPTNTLFNTPEMVPSVLHPTHDQYFTDGFKAKITSVANAPMGYTTNVQTGNAAVVARNDKTTIYNAFTPQNFQGDENYDGTPDMLQLIVNEIRYLTGPEIPRSMPWPVPEAKHAYRDVPAEGVFQADATATLQVKDSNDGKLQGGTYDNLENFQSCSPWPNGWAETQGFAWQCGPTSYVGGNGAVYWYYYDWTEATHVLTSRQYDLSGMDMSAASKRVTLTYKHAWLADFSPFDPAAFQDGYVEVSADNFATFTTVAQYHDLNPTQDQGTKSYDISQYAGVSNLRVRFSIRGYDDEYWEVTNVEIYAEWGTRVDGLGTGTATVTVVNVPPTIDGGPTSQLSNEASPIAFNGYKIEDPTLYNPYTGAWDPVTTEWFAYRWNFDDGTMSPWTYTGSLALPKLKILVLHTLSFGTGDAFLAMLRGIDLVSQVDAVDFLYMSPSQLPSLSTMLGYDAVIVATNYAVFSSTFDLTRQTIGDRLADYMDAKPNAAVITLMATYDLSPFYGELFTMLGRYMDQNYGSFEKATYGFTAATLGQVLDPSHPVMQGVHKLTSSLISSGDYPVVPGAELLARWDSGNAAIGVHELPNGARSVNIGAFAGQDPSSVCGGDCATLIRNAIIWGSRTVVPTNQIPTFSHNWGDNGVYNVDLMVLDDNMGWEWDPSTGAPVAIQGLPQTMTHYAIPVQVNNVDPTIDHSSVQAFIAGDVCLRVSGDSWNTVSLGFFTDGALTGRDTVTRAPGSPNDQTKCTFERIDVLAPHVFSTQVDFTPAQGATSGTNDWWVIIMPWRTPITPGHGTVTFKGQSQVGDPTTYTVTTPLPTLKSDLIAGGQGAPIEFAATATDPGTDDLAFVWIWGDGTPDTVNVHHNADGSVTTGTIGNPELLGFTEPFFNRSADTGRSPWGTAPFTARDQATHSVSGSGRFMWVTLIVLDDDNSRGYPSHFLRDGTDMAFVVLDFS